MSERKAECIYDMTFFFAHRYFVPKKDRTVDQVVQAARSGKQNIAEGCSAATTSSETEIKLLGVARASMKEVLEDYKDYLRTRQLEEWAADDPRVLQTKAFCRQHSLPSDYLRDIERRSLEALCNIAITLLCQFDVLIGRLLDRVQKDFVEEGGIRERMTAARLGFRGEQKARIAELEAENKALKARVAELEGLLLIFPIFLLGCSGGGEELTVQPSADEVAIVFAASQGEQREVTRGTRAATPLSERATAFTVWGYKNMSVDDDSYGDKQQVFPGFDVRWQSGSNGTTTTNSSGWDYILADKAEQTVKYWDWEAAAYRFFAVTGSEGSDGANGANGTYGANGAYGAYEVAVAADVTSSSAVAAMPYFSRLWFSTGNPGEYPERQFGSPVQLVFLQAVSRVRFMFTYAQPPEGILINSAKFKPSDGSGIALKGTVTVHYPLEGPETQEWYTTVAKANPAAGEVLEAFDDDYDAAEGRPWYDVLPVSSQGSYTLKVTINGEVRTCSVPAALMQWLPGHSYTYVFKINEEGGVELGNVQAAFTDWTADIEGTHNVYNW